MALITALPADEQQGRPEYPNAYARVLHVLVYADAVWVHVNWYENEEARRRGDAPVFERPYGIVPSDISGEVFPQVYSYIKTLEEFAGATDC